jgi:hypothetical protein
VVLLQDAHTLTLGHFYLTGSRVYLAREDLHESGLPCPISTYNSIAIAVGKPDVYVFEQDTLTVAQ